MSTPPSAALRSAQTIGIVLILVWVVLSAAKDVYLGHLAQGIDPILMLAVCIALTVVFFNATQITNRAGYAEAVKRNFADIVWLNLFTAAAWGSFFAALKFLEAAVAESFIVAVDPLSTILLARAMRRAIAVSSSELAASWAMLVASAFLGIAVWYGKSSVGVLSTSDATFGIVCVLLCGIANGGITVVSKRLADGGLSASQVMGSRFFVLLTGSLIFVALRAPSLHALTDELGGVLLIGVFGVITPMFVLQKAIERLEPVTVVLVGCIIPVVAFALQQLDSRLQFSWASFVGVSVIFLIVMFATYRSFRTGHAA